MNQSNSWEAWWQSPAGQYVLQWEQRQFDAAVSDVFGFHALQCGGPQWDGLRANRMALRVHGVLAVDSMPVHAAVAVRFDLAEELPFASHSLDLLLLPHGLERTADPHQVLREAERVLRPEGRLIVSGFNPISLWGARQALPPVLASPFWPSGASWIGPSRLRDWCKLLSLEAVSVQYGCWRPACRSAAWLDRMRVFERMGDRWWPICGAVYLLAAIKRVRAVRWVGPAWRRAAPTRPLAVASARRVPEP